MSSVYKDISLWNSEQYYDAIVDMSHVHCSCSYLAYIPIYWTISAIEKLWDLSTLLQYRAHISGEMAA
jgi:hypothetical protein